MLATLMALTVMSAPQLTILTYNIHHGEGEDGVFDLERIAGVIKSADPDIVALQEVDRGTGRASGVDQAAVLGELTGMYSMFGEAMPFDGGSYGEAVLSKWRLLRSKQYPLPYDDGEEPRVAFAVQVLPAAGIPEITFVATHLDHQSDQTRLWQCGRINVDFNNSVTPLLLAGDLNATPESRPIKELLDYGWVDTGSDSGPTYPSDKPRKRIDYVLYRKKDPWKVVSVKVLDEPVASDHAPVLVVLEWTG